jgi:hypothetical protein
MATKRALHERIVADRGGRRDPDGSRSEASLESVAACRTVSATGACARFYFVPFAYRSRESSAGRPAARVRLAILPMLYPCRSEAERRLPQDQRSPLPRGFPDLMFTTHDTLHASPRSGIENIGSENPARSGLPFGLEPASLLTRRSIEAIARRRRAAAARERGLREWHAGGTQRNRVAGACKPTQPGQRRQPGASHKLRIARAKRPKPG